MNSKFLELKKMIDDANVIALCAHINPDGDAIGSSSGLYHILKNMGKDVHLIKNDEFPTNLEFIKDKTNYEDINLETDLFIVMDVADKKRIGNAIDVFEKSKKKVCIDHHQTNGGFSDLDIIFPKESSTCEIIADICLSLGYDIPEDAATLLYLGITTDTNRFMYESTSPKTLRIAANLIELGADKRLIIDNLYEKLDMNYHLLQAKIMSESEFLENGKIVLAKLTKETLEEYGLDFDKVESLVSILKSIDGVEVAVLVKEYGEFEQKISMRSKSFVNVSDIAREFGGGGHIRASGLTLNENVDDAYSIIKKRMERFVNEGNISCK
ncbi:MAG: bifunctional oligoribonuclease/PAP phosphatase NrnA [Tissierellia bacterium]|nr:bifunctional oligoribonuclease/PAP phosphatase NrnA [Tissierellia bacterium]